MNIKCTHCGTVFSATGANVICPKCKFKMQVRKPSPEKKMSDEELGDLIDTYYGQSQIKNTRKKKNKKKKNNYVLRRLLIVLGLFVLMAGLIAFVIYKIYSTQEPQNSLPDSAGQAMQAISPENSPITTFADNNVSDDNRASSENAEINNADEQNIPADEPKTSSEDDWQLLLVNSDEPLPADFTVELVNLVEQYKVDARIADSVKQMIAAAKESGINLMICSAYRPVESQENLYAQSIEKYIAQGKTKEEAEALTAQYYAYPGTSEHHTGLALDIVTPNYQTLDDGYAATTAAKWLAENGHKYGFILRYPQNKEEITKISFEPWHYRFVGTKAALDIYSNGLCLEEYLYLKSIENNTPSSEHEAEPPTDNANAGIE